MVHSVQQIIKGKGFSGIKFTSQSQQSNLRYLQKIKDVFDDSYNSDGGPGHFFDMEYLEDTQYSV